MSKTKFDNIIFKYLDMELDDIEETKGKYVDIVLRYPGEGYGTIGIQKIDNGDIKVYVFFTLVEKIINLFSMESSDALDVIGRYIGNRYNLRVIDTRYFWQ
jgi:hypothetical protein